VSYLRGRAFCELLVQHFSESQEVIRQNNGTLPKRRRTAEFKKLTDEEVGMLEAVVNDAFDGFGEGGPDKIHDVDEVPQHHELEFPEPNEPPGQLDADS
jgi:hypothetical protein